MSLMRIDEIFTFEKGVLQSSKCVPGEYDFITASSDWKTHNEYTHDCEALIFAAAASGSLGRTHYVNGKFISSDLCFIITPKDQENLPVDLKFYHILFSELKDEIVRNTKAGTSKEAIGLGSFGKYELPYFDIDTQVKIKNQFVNSENIKSNLTTELYQQVTLIKKLRQQLLQDAVQGKLVEQNKKDEPASELLKRIKAEKEKLIAEKKLKKEKELPPIKPEEIPFEIPENWVWCRLGDLAEIVRGGSPRPAGDPTFYDGAIPFLKVGDLTGYEDIYVRTHTYSIKEAGLHKTRFVEADTLMLTNSGATLGIPRICTFPTTFNDGIAAFLNLKNIEKVYLYYFLKSKSAWYLKEASRGQGQPNLNTDIIALTPFPLPPLNEQKRIVEKLEELMEYCNELESSIKQSESQNEKLLQQVLREALRKEPVEA
jgi:type I restriction enzyme S subunit